MVKAARASFYGLYLSNFDTLIKVGQETTEIGMGELFKYEALDAVDFIMTQSGTEGVFNAELSGEKLTISRGLVRGNAELTVFARIKDTDVEVRTVLSIINNDTGQTDDFEYSILADSPFDWLHDGNSQWHLDGTSVFSGVRSLRSGTTDHSMTSEVSVETVLSETGTVTFAYKTSSYITEYLGEYDGDFLNFYANGINLTKKENRALWGGVNDWRLVSYDLDAGSYTLKWQYSKNDWGTYFNDAVWIDHVIIPGTPVKNSNTQPPVAKKILIDAYPNPFNPLTKICFELSQAGKASLVLYDSSGRIAENIFDKHFSPGSYSAEIDGSKFSAGIYFAVLRSGLTTNCLKLVLLK
jgi:hypothetical protein